MDILLVFSTIISLVILVSVVELIRRNRLKEKYSILWLVSSFLMLCFSVSRDFLHDVSSIIGIKYPPSLIFLAGFLFLIIINIHFSSVVSELADKNRTLSQEIALLKQELKEKGH